MNHKTRLSQEENEERQKKKNLMTKYEKREGSTHWEC